MAWVAVFVVSRALAYATFFAACLGPLHANRTRGADMPARRCSSCKINWPTTKGLVNCPECGTALVFYPSKEPDRETPLTVRKILDPVTPEVMAEVMAGWASLRTEFVRRKGHFSMADLIEDFPRAGGD